MKLRVKAALLLLALTLAVLGVSNARADEPFRFLVMGDPQFQVPREGAWEATLNYGYEWQSPTWKAMPRIMDGLDAQYFFVCGDIFQYQDGDGTTAPALGVKVTLPGPRAVLPPMSPPWFYSGLSSATCTCWARMRCGYGAVTVICTRLETTTDRAVA